MIGVVAAYLPYHDIAISQQTRRPRIVFEENSGLASIVPIDRVIDTIDAFLVANPSPAAAGSDASPSDPSAVVPAAVTSPAA